MTRFATPMRPAGAQEMDECYRALRSAYGRRGEGTSARLLAAQLGWRTSRTETALAGLHQAGRARPHERTGEWFPVGES